MLIPLFIFIVRINNTNSFLCLEYRRIYLFKSLNRGKRPKCFGSKSRCNSFVSKNKNKISKPPACPIGYNQSNFTQSCSYCNYSHGEPERCPCTNWMTCAQRFYGYRHGCTQHPYTFFTVRECSQGKCLYNLFKKLQFSILRGFIQSCLTCNINV